MKRNPLDASLMPRRTESPWGVVRRSFSGEMKCKTSSLSDRRCQNLNSTGDKWRSDGGERKTIDGSE
jgi:hypothetical protein